MSFQIINQIKSETTGQDSGFLLLLSDKNDKRKIGDRTGTLEDWPFLVLIVNKDTSRVSTGTLIKPNLVLTSAYAIQGGKRVLVCGNIHELKQSDMVCSYGTPIIHPDFYNEGNDVIKNDIGLIRLDHDLPIGKLKMVKLKNNDCEWHSPTCRCNECLQPLKTASWAINNVLLSSPNLEVHFNGKRFVYEQDQKISDVGKSLNIPDCITTMKKTSGATGNIFGYAGAPLFRGKEQMGILNGKSKLHNKGDVVWTRVNKYQKWIKSIMEETESAIDTDNTEQLNDTSEKTWEKKIDDFESDPINVFTPKPILPEDKSLTRLKDWCFYKFCNKPGYVNHYTSDTIQPNLQDNPLCLVTEPKNPTYDKRPPGKDDNNGDIFTARPTSHYAAQMLNPDKGDFISEIREEFPTIFKRCRGGSDISTNIYGRSVNEINDMDKRKEMHDMNEYNKIIERREIIDLNEKNNKINYFENDLSRNLRIIPQEETNLFTSICNGVRKGVSCARNTIKKLLTTTYGDNECDYLDSLHPVDVNGLKVYKFENYNKRLSAGADEYYTVHTNRYDDENRWCLKEWSKDRAGDYDCGSDIYNYIDTCKSDDDRRQKIIDQVI